MRYEGAPVAGYPPGSARLRAAMCCLPVGLRGGELRKRQLEDCQRRLDLLQHADGQMSTVELRRLEGWD